MLRKLLKTLYFQVIIAIVAGILLGHFYPKIGVDVKPLGDMFIRLIKMIITPIVFVTVVQGIFGAGDLKRVGKLGLTTLIYFEVVSTLALIIGLMVVNIVQPGAGLNADVASLGKGVAESAMGGGGNALLKGGFLDFIMQLIPANIVDSFAKGNILQVLVFAIMFGFALTGIGKQGEMIFHFIEELSKILFAIVAQVMRVAPIGAFGAMGFTVGKYGIASLWSLGKLMAAFYCTSILFIVFVLGAITWWCRVSLWQLIRYFKEELLITLGTATTEAVMPRLLSKLEKIGCSKSVVGLVIPTGYSFNLDGAAIYLTMASMFIAQATNTYLDIWQQITILAVLMITSKGGAGVVGSAFVVLAATLSSLGTIPVEGMALILGIDRFMNEARAITNMIGNTIATIAVAKWENEFNITKYHEVVLAESDKNSQKQISI